VDGALKQFDPRAGERAVELLLAALGEDGARDGLRETPKRVMRAWREMTSGYNEDPARVLAKRFDADGYDEMIAVRDIEFWSTCEHHLLPFHGKVTVGYLPGTSVVGLSKIPRLVHCFARRLQIQERLTSQIATALERHVEAKGVGVVMSATHLCMAARGVRAPSQMITSKLLGTIRDDARARSEFLAFAGI
jgi:GTP cyclohydrolase I